MNEQANNQAPAEAAPAHGRRRGRKRRIALVVIILLALAGVIYYLWSRQFETTDDAFLETNITNLAIRVAGQVQEVKIDDNQEVRAGELLVSIDPRDLQAKVDQARSALAAARSQAEVAQAQVKAAQAAAEQVRAQLAGAQAQNQRAQEDLRRFESLFKENVTSQQQYQLALATAKSTQAAMEAAQKAVGAADAQVAQAVAGVQAAQDRVGQAQAALAQAELNLSYARVTAPISGRVTSKNVDIGDYLQVGQPLLALVPSEFWVVANFKETQLTRMRPGLAVTIKIDAYPARKFRGHVESIQRGSGAVFSLLPPENATGNYVKVVQRVPVKIVFDEPLGDVPLGPGMSVVPRVRVR